MDIATGLHSCASRRRGDYYSDNRVCWWLRCHGFMINAFGVFRRVGLWVLSWNPLNVAYGDLPGWLGTVFLSSCVVFRHVNTNPSSGCLISVQAKLRRPLQDVHFLRWNNQPIRHSEQWTHQQMKCILMAPNVRKGDETRAFVLFKADINELPRHSILVTIEAEKPDLPLLTDRAVDRGPCWWYLWTSLARKWSGGWLIEPALSITVYSKIDIGAFSEMCACKKGVSMTSLVTWSSPNQIRALVPWRRGNHEKHEQHGSATESRTSYV